MRFRNFILVPLLLALSSAAFGIAPASVKRYTALRRSSATSVPLDTLKSEPASYIGKIFELRGVACGFSKNSSGSSIIISTVNNGSMVVSTDAPPCENPGMTLACLVKIGPGSTHSLSDLQLIACTYDAELQRAEQEAAARSAHARTAQTTAQQSVQQTADTQTAASGNGKTIDAEKMVVIYKNAIRRFNRKLTDSQADTISRSILGFSNRYRIDPRLVCAVILAESHFRLSATSGSGAQGLGQLMPGTAAGLGVNNAYDPVQNVYGSARYIRSMLDRVSGNKKWESLSWYDLGLALAAYNAGPGAVKKHGGIPPYKETQNYVRRVTSIYKQLCGVK